MVVDFRHMTERIQIAQNATVNPSAEGLDKSKYRHLSLLMQVANSGLRAAKILPVFPKALL
jgi:hypothetical protein